MRLHLFTRPAAVAATMAIVAVLAAVPASANTGPSKVRTEHIQIMSTSGTATAWTIVATGVFTAGGSVSGSLATGGSDTVTFPAGSFVITADKVARSSNRSAKSCLTTSRVSGFYKIHGGTGKYAKIGGFGKFVFSSVSVGTRTAGGRCGQPITSEMSVVLDGPAGV